MMKIKYLILLAAGLGMVSCEGLLEQKNPNQPDSETFWQTEEDVQSGLYAAYRPLRFNGEYRRWYHVLYVSRSDEGYSMSPNVTFQSYSNFNTINDGGAEAVLYTWLDTYKGIFWANQVLYNGADVEFDDPQAKEQCMGQAYFLRGLGFFNIAGIYGRGPTPLIPDMEEYNEGYEILEQTDIYLQARADLLAAASRLPETWPSEDLGRITKGAAWGMLAKVSGQLAGCYEGNNPTLATQYWTDMKLYCDSIINSGLYSIANVDYASNFSETGEFNDESVFEVQFAPDRSGVSQLSHERAMFLGIPCTGGAYDDATARNSVYDEFAIERATNGQFDPRLKATLFYYQDPDGVEDRTTYYGTTFGAMGGSVSRDKVYWKKYTQWDTKSSDNPESHSNNGINIRVIRLADIYLMRAEAMNELNMAQGDILADINVVRSRVGMPSLPSTVYPASAFDSKDKMRVQIMHERTCELAGESWRWLDLDRWFFRDMDGDGIKETMLDSYQIDGMTPLEWLQSRDSEFDEFKDISVPYRAFRFPIPSRELPLVDGLEQNPGW